MPPLYFDVRCSVFDVRCSVFDVRCFCFHPYTSLFLILSQGSTSTLAKAGNALYLLPQAKAPHVAHIPSFQPLCIHENAAKIGLRVLGCTSGPRALVRTPSHWHIRY